MLNVIEDFHTNLRTLQLATVNQDGFPHASYAPFLFENGCFYVRLSTMAQHGNNLLHDPRVSILLIEDESDCENLLARKRLMLDCESHEVERDSTEWNKIQQSFSERFSETSNDSIAGFLDFHLFALQPIKGRLVLGFGQAYGVTGELQTTELQGGGGHRSQKR